MAKSTSQGETLADRLETARKASGREPTRRVMVYLPASTYDRLKEFCDARDLTLTGVAQVAIEALLDQTS